MIPLATDLNITDFRDCSACTWNYREAKIWSDPTCEEG
jgi:hypothetical protein